MNSFSSNGKIQLRPFRTQDQIIIENWPAYPPEFAELDYALRKDGWIAQFHGQPDTWLYAAVQSGELIAFAIIFLTGQTEAEFRIALRPDKVG